jgi:hypothetical protein
MVTRNDFTDKEWETIVDAPISVGLGMSYMQKTGPIGTIRELGEASRAMVSFVNKHQSRPFFQLLKEDQKTNRQPGSSQEGLKGKSWQEKRVFLREQALAQGQEAVAIIEAKAGPADARAYRDGLIHVATRVMQKSKSGGFLGIGGTKVTPEEQEFLEELKTALDAGMASRP